MTFIYISDERETTVVPSDDSEQLSYMGLDFVEWYLSNGPKARKTLQKHRLSHLYRAAMAVCDSVDQATPMAELVEPFLQALAHIEDVNRDRAELVKQEMASSPCNGESFREGSNVVRFEPRN